MELVPLILLTPILVATACFDLKFLRIPNALCLAALLLFLATAPFLPIAEVGARTAAGVLVFGMGFIMFALRLVGGGDVKMMAALLLFVPTGSYALFAISFSCMLFLGVGVMLGLRTIAASRDAKWASLRHRDSLPMGISIAATGLLHPYLVLALG